MNVNRYSAGSSMKRKYENGKSDDKMGPTPPKQYGYNSQGHMGPGGTHHHARSHESHRSAPDQMRCGPPEGPTGRGWNPRGRGPMSGGGYRGNWCARPGMMGPPPRGFFHGRGRGGHPPPHTPRAGYNNYQGEWMLPVYYNLNWPEPHESEQNQYRGWNHQGGPHGGPSSHCGHPTNNNQANVRVKKEQASDGSEAGGGSDEVVKESKKSKRSRANAQNQPAPLPIRPWNREDAEKALKVEVDTTRILRNQSLIIRFPDPELSRDIVKQYHPGIQNVHFQVPSGPRYCFVQLAPNVNSEKAIKMLESIKFGNGRLTVEKKSMKQEEEISPESIDPYTLYIGNLPTNVNISTVKEKFPNAVRVDVGFAQKMRFTRYAFIRYNNVDEAIKAYKDTHSLVLDSRSIIVRFRRQKGQIDLPGEAKTQNPPRVMVKPEIKKENEESGVKNKEEDEEDEEKDEEEDDDDEEDEEGDDDDDDDDDDDEEEREGVDDDDDDDDDEEEGRKPIADDDDDDDDEEEENNVEEVEEQELERPIIADDDDDDDPDNLFRDLDAQLGDMDGFSFNFN